ncbi:MAG: glycerate kinase, partial [Clostridia bacterium]|nr:glycerate kinase [Clostridia bacterium]
MKILIATDSFKGSLTSIQAGNAIAKGIEQSGVDAQIDLCPLADGGEGTVDAFAVATNATCHVVRVTGPLGTQTDATYCTFDDVAVVEMAQCAGLDLVGQNKNPLVATTFGVGEVILHAIKKGCKKFVIGIGGSATNDGGIGMLQALGFGFFDKQNN